MKWIKCTDQQPKDGTRVLCVRNGKFLIAYFITFFVKGKFLAIIPPSSKETQNELEEINYWIAIPELPEEE